MEKADVLIVGAGPVGLIAANILGYYGVKTLIIDKNDEPFTYPRALGIDDETLRSLQWIGFSQQEIDDLCMPIKVEYFSLTGYRCFEPDPQMKRYGYPVLSSFFQPKLEGKLQEKLQCFPSVTFLRACNFIAYEQTNEEILVRYEYKNKIRNVKCKYLLGCDGGKSDVRHCAKITMPGSTLRDALVVDLNDSEMIRQNILEYRTNNTARQRPLASLNAPGGLRRFEVLLNDNEHSLGDLEEPLVKDILHPFIKNIKPEILRSRIYRLYFRIAERYNDGNVFLLGDAAHLVPPYGGQGMCSGIKDAVNLSWKLAYCLQNKAKSDLLGTYELERRQHMLQIMNFIQTMSKNLESDQPVPKSEEKIESTYYRKIKPLPVYSDGFLFHSKYSGDLLLQPEVTDHNGNLTLLDEHLGREFSIISLDYDAEKSLSTKNKAFWNGLGCRFVTLNRQKSNVTTNELLLSKSCDILNDLEVDTVIVRPDRFILGTCKQDDLNLVMNNLVQQLHHYLGGG